LRINLDMRPPRALPAAHFDRNESYAYFGDRTLNERVPDRAYRNEADDLPARKLCATLPLRCGAYFFC